MGVGSPTTKLYRESHADSSGADWQEVAELLSVSFPDKSKEVIDITDLNASNLYRIFKSGFRDAGRVTFRCNFGATQYGRLNEDFDSDHMGQFRIVLPDTAASEFVFTGLLVRLGGAVPEGSGSITCDCEIKLSGQPSTEPS